MEFFEEKIDVLEHESILRDGKEPGLLKLRSCPKGANAGSKAVRVIPRLTIWVYEAGHSE
jgi:hypothetical protein